jgi:hypothetical protein
MLYLAMIPVFIYYFSRKMNEGFGFTLLQTAMLGAIFIIPIQYISAFVLLWKHPDSKPLRNYIGIASLMITLVASVWISMIKREAFDEAQFLLLNYILGVSGLVLGMFYIWICRKLASR